MKDEVVNNWGALESIVTSISGFLGSLGFMWWRQNQLEKEQDKQKTFDADMKEKVFALQLKIETDKVDANTKAMNHMAESLRMFAEGNAKKDALLEKLDRSIDELFKQVRVIEREYVSSDTCKAEHRNR